MLFPPNNCSKGWRVPSSRQISSQPQHGTRPPLFPRVLACFLLACLLFGYTQPSMSDEPDRIESQDETPASNETLPQPGRLSHLLTPRSRHHTGCRSFRGCTGLETEPSRFAFLRICSTGQCAVPATRECENATECQSPLTPEGLSAFDCVNGECVALCGGIAGIACPSGLQCQPVVNCSDCFGTCVPGELLRVGVCEPAPE